MAWWARLVTTTALLLTSGAAVGLTAPAGSAAPAAPSLMATQDMTGTLPSGGYGVAMVLSADGSTLVVASQNHADGSGTLGVHRFDAATGRLLATGRVTPPFPNAAITGLALDPVRSRVWLMASSHRYVFDAASLSLLTSTTDWRAQLIGMVAPPTGGPVYGLTASLNPGSPGSIVELDPESGRVLREVVLTEPGARRPTSNWYLSASRLLLDPSGTRLYALPRDGTDLVVVDPVSMTILGRAPAGASPESMALSPTSGQVFVADINDRVLRRFDMQTLVDQGSSPLRGRCPGALATDALGERAVVGNPCGGDPYQVFDPRTGQDLSAPFAQGNGMSMWMSPDGSRIIGLDSGGASAVTGYRIQTRQEIAAAKRAATPLPTPPRQVSATLDGTAVALSWVAPTNSRRSRVTQYVVTAKPGGQQCTTRTTRCSIRGLTRGQTYAFTVKARNVIGWGPAAVSRYVPVPLPTPVTPAPPDVKPPQDLS